MKKFISSSIYKNDLPKVVKLANALGCGIELSRFKICSTDFEKMEAIAKVKADLAGFDGELSLHSYFFDLNVVSRDPEIERISHMRFNQALDIAKELGINTVLYHSGFNSFKHVDYQNEFAELSFAFWSKFVKKVEDYNITAVIENVLESTPASILDVVKEINSPNLRASLDTGHANLYSDISIPEWIRAYKDVLHHMHIHNNFGNDDAHDSILRGTLNFEEIFATIKELNIQPKIVFEIFKEDALVESVNYFNEFFK